MPKNKIPKPEKVSYLFCLFIIYSPFVFKAHLNHRKNVHHERGRGEQTQRH